MERIVINLLGSFNVLAGGQKINDDFRTSKERALLAYLVVEHQQVHLRDALAEMFWPGKPPGSARTNLRQALTGIRQVLTQGLNNLDNHLIVNNESVQLHLGGQIQVDALTFAGQIHHAGHHTHLELSQCPKCLAELEEAVAAYQGNFLESFFLPDSITFQEWITYQREYYNRQLGSALWMLISAHKKRVDFERVEQYAAQMNRFFPLEEFGYRELMEVYAATGRRNAALEKFSECANLMQRELGIEPSGETQALYEKIKRNPDTRPLAQTREPPAARIPTGESPVKTNLQAPLTNFFGRQKELNRLATYLESPNCRLITILGISGVGKTRLALEAARKNGHLFPDGVWIVFSNELRKSRFLADTLLQTMGVYIANPNDVKAQLARVLQNQQALLVLDGFELLEDQIQLVLDLLSQAPRLKILLTSRVHLNTKADYPIILGSLDYPPQTTQSKTLQINDYPALQLLHDRAYPFLLPEQIPPAHIQEMAKICQEVEGLPLAIELIAANLDEFSFGEILAMLANNQLQIETQQLDFPDKHRSLVVALNSLWESLCSECKQNAPKLNVFKSGFTSQAAQALGVSNHTLQHLSSKFILQKDIHQRYQFQPMVQRLIVSMFPVAAEQAERHARHYLEYLQKHEMELLFGYPNSLTYLEIKQDIANIRQAIDWAILNTRADLLSPSLNSIYAYYDTSNRFHEGEGRFERISKAFERLPLTPENQRSLGIAMGYQAWFSGRGGALENALVMLASSLALLEEFGTESDKTFIYVALSQLELRSGQFAWAKEHADQAKALAIHYYQPHWRWLSELTLAQTAHLTHEKESPVTIYLECLSAFKNLGYGLGYIRTLLLLARYNLATNQAEMAKSHLMQAWEYIKSPQDTWLSAILELELGNVELQQGFIAQSQLTLEKSYAYFQDVGDKYHISLAAISLGNLWTKQGQLEKAEMYYQEALVAGNQQQLEPITREVEHRLLKLRESPTR